MNPARTRIVTANGIRIRLTEQGAGPAVLLCHGFPETAYSWRHQLRALAEAGYRAIAPDMRGYGGTDRPEPIDAYTLLHLVGDMVGILDALDLPDAVIAGHDWGAPVAWHAALLRPDRFRAVIGLSVPFRPRTASQPTSRMPQDADALFYQLYFQTPGVAEAELGRDPRASLHRLLWAASGEGSGGAAGGFAMVPRTGGFLTRMDAAPRLPTWLTAADLESYAASFAASGFAGGLNWYRNIARNWELLAAFADRRIEVPALYVVGDRDPVKHFRGMDETLAALPRWVPGLRETLILPGCGHWTQQERPAEVNAAMIAFLAAL